VAHRHEDWLAQARHDLKAAKDSLAAQNFDWVAYQAQQAAEKAVKPLLRYHGVERRGHNIYQFLAEAEQLASVPPALLVHAQELDEHFSRPRYPNGFDHGYPGAIYDEETAKRCLSAADAILSFVEANTS